MTEDFTAKMLNKGALLFFLLWKMDFGPAYFSFACEKWTLGELINSLPGLGHGLSLGLGTAYAFP